jgi:hypothetical protein
LGACYPGKLQSRALDVAASNLKGIGTGRCPMQRKACAPLAGRVSSFLRHAKRKSA